jgi:hypothetical protein
MSKLKKGGAHRKKIKVDTSKIKRLQKEFGLRKPKTKGDSIYLSNVMGVKRRKDEGARDRERRIDFYQKNKKGLKAPKRITLKKK